MKLSQIHYFLVVLMIGSIPLVREGMSAIENQTQSYEYIAPTPVEYPMTEWDQSQALTLTWNRQRLEKLN